MWQWLLSLFGGKSEAGPAPSSQNSQSASTTNCMNAPIITKQKYPEARIDTPNKAGKITPSGVILHHSDGSYLGGVAWITSKQSKVSYHCLIARDGRRTVFADDTDRCWHAGKSGWGSKGEANGWAIGLSWEGDTYKNPLEDAAMDSAIEYLVPRIKKWNIKPEFILTHEQVSPGRKNDIKKSEAERFKARLMMAMK